MVSPAACLLRMSMAMAMAAFSMCQSHPDRKADIFRNFPVSLDEEKMHSCGNPAWRTWYADLVQQIRGGSLPPRYYINGHFHTGLSDRLVIHPRLLTTYHIIPCAGSLSCQSM